MNNGRRAAVSIERCKAPENMTQTRWTVLQKGHKCHLLFVHMNILYIYIHYMRYISTVSTVSLTINIFTFTGDYVIRIHLRRINSNFYSFCVQSFICDACNSYTTSNSTETPKQQIKIIMWTSFDIISHRIYFIRIWNVCSLLRCLFLLCFFCIFNIIAVSLKANTHTHSLTFEFYFGVFVFIFDILTCL